MISYGVVCLKRSTVHLKIAASAFAFGDSFSKAMDETMVIMTALLIVLLSAKIAFSERALLEVTLLRVSAARLAPSEVFSAISVPLNEAVIATEVLLTIVPAIVARVSHFSAIARCSKTIRVMGVGAFDGLFKLDRHGRKRVLSRLSLVEKQRAVAMVPKQLY